jgi:hypothetical protein
MPIKVTWKSITGALSLLAGVVSSLNAIHGLPSNVSTALVAIGGVILAAERIADALDNATSSKAKLPITRQGSKPTP